MLLIKPVLRSRIFRDAPFTDQFIAGIQEAYGKDYDPSVRSEAAILKQRFDHRIAFHNTAINTSGHCIIAINAANKAAYIAQLPAMLIQFLSALKITSVYLVDWLCTNLNDFPFENHKKRNQFKLLAGKYPKEYGYEVETTALKKVLPLFFFARRYDVPVIFLFSASNNIPLAINLCDDGNLHLSYPAAQDASVKKAARACGFATGGLEICSVYSTSYLRHPGQGS